MKKILIIIAAIAVIVFAVWFFRKKNAENNAADTVDPVVPPASAAPLFTDNGEGLIAIQTRINQLTKGGQYNKFAANISAGAVFRGAEDGAFPKLLPGASGYAWPLTDKQVITLTDASILASQPDPKAQMQTLQKANLAFKSAGLPEFLPYDFVGGGERNFFKGLICSYYPGCPNNFIGNKAKFIPFGQKMYADLNTVAKNMLAINASLNEQVRDKALSDLIASGYKFVGYTTNA